MNEALPLSGPPTSALQCPNPIDPLPDHWIDWLHNDIHRSNRARGLSVSHLFAGFDQLALGRLLPHSDPRPFLALFRGHDYCTAIVSEVIAECVGLPVESAHVCGLLHDLGFVSALRRVDTFCTIETMPHFLRIRPTLVRAAEYHAVQMGLRWRLPSHIRFAIRDHTLYSTLTTPSLLSSVTHLAEHLADQLGYALGFDHRPEHPTDGVAEALRHLGLSLGELRRLRDQASTRVLSQPTYMIWTRTAALSRADL